MVALSSLDGDIEHTQREYLTMTYSCEKMGICNAKAEILYRARKNNTTVERAVEKSAARKNRKTADTSTTHKDAKLHELAGTTKK